MESNLTIKYAPEEETMMFHCGGCFGNTMQRDFCNAYELEEGVVKQYIIDLAEVSFVDSIGLGILVALHEHSVRKNAKVIIRHLCPSVRETLELSNLDQIFDIEG